MLGVLRKRCAALSKDKSVHCVCGVSCVAWSPTHADTCCIARDLMHACACKVACGADERFRRACAGHGRYPHLQCFEACHPVVDGLELLKLSGLAFVKRLPVRGQPTLALLEVRRFACVLSHVHVAKGGLLCGAVFCFR
jgi:hypothetical protein